MVWLLLPLVGTAKLLLARFAKSVQILHFANYTLFVSQTADVHFAKYRFPFHFNWQIIVSHSLIALILRWLNFLEATCQRNFVISKIDFYVKNQYLFLPSTKISRNTNFTGKSYKHFISRQTCIFFLRSQKINIFMWIVTKKRKTNLYFPTLTFQIFYGSF